MFPEFMDRYWRGIGFGLLLAWFTYVQGISSLAVILPAAALHEAGHIFAVWAFGGRARFAGLSAAGAQVKTDSYLLSYFQESLAVLAGPFANFMAGMILGALSPDLPWCAAASGANWVLGVFNLLPAAPLDGWRILHLLMNWWLGPATGSRIAAGCGMICAVLLAVGLVILVAASGGNLWLLPAAAAVLVNGIQTVRKDW